MPRISISIVAAVTGRKYPVVHCPDGIVIALNQLDQILNIDLAGRTAVVQPGVINSKLTAAVSHAGMHYALAPDPSSQQVCDQGNGLSRVNSGGAHCLKYGMTSNHVLAMKVVLADGSVVEVGAKAAEAIGPDMRLGRQRRRSIRYRD
ncbi:MAG: FAD-binding oxidoreductase [Pirellulales bacterium]